MQIVAAIAETEAYLADISLDDFLTISKTRSAVLYQLMIVGEATAHLSPKLRVKYPHVKWQPVVAFRIQVIHGYASVDCLLVWNAAMADAPGLLILIAVILKQEASDTLDFENPR